MAGSGYKLYATGDILTAAQVNNYLQEQTVMVFADAAARTTALASVLAEGMISYLKDTDVTQYYSGSAWVTIGGSASPLTTKGDLYGYSTTNARVAVGTNGQVLTADSTAAVGVAWAAPASYTQISSTSIAGAGTSISSIAGTYNKLVLVVQDWYPSTNGENLRLRFNGDSTAAAYGQAGVSAGVAYSNSQNFLWASYQGAVNSDNNNFLVLEIENYANTNSHKVARYANYYLSGATQMIDEGAMRWKNTAAITSIDFASTSGNIGQGTAILWGVK
jgi:hypothetical protein